ncbi:hypothetical protein JAAARDRAFT_202396 [Jaapia argillacea MUCL 33604]|uniref:D-arabinono-1,4-lactone oxidase C-terminal domain-containing protein n=1 Tax=Jaapia argillacea MUCL 33604 TaxID=933084 RepID=A0A067QG55_9AGAM|nr:hypothetical protein JAAARDRAFT_202396 [Jaapia argillacea MUCL 33604]
MNPVDAEYETTTDSKSERSAFNLFRSPHSRSLLTYVSSHNQNITHDRVSAHQRSNEFDVKRLLGSHCDIDKLEEVVSKSNTGIILKLELSAEEKLCFKDARFWTSFDHAVRDLEEFTQSSQYSRMWWFPQTNVAQIGLLDHTSEVDEASTEAPVDHTPTSIPPYTIPTTPRISIPLFDLWPEYLASWFVRGKTVTIDERYRIFNLDYQNPTELRPHLPAEIRFSEDEIWLSPSYGRRTGWIRITQYKPFGFDVPHGELFSNFASILLRHDARPHWTKAHNLGPGLLRKL